MRTSLSIGLVAAIFAGAACSASDPVGFRGELMVVLATDLVPPKDLDRLVVEIDHRGTTQTKTYTLPSTKLPATLAVASDPGDADPVTIRVTSYLKGMPRVVREAVTTVPDGRVATLRMPIDWLCDGTAAGSAPVTPVAAACAVGETCKAGKCVSSLVDSALLPTYDAATVFGGASMPSGGQCFDVLACFANAANTSLRLDDCTVTGNPVGPDAGPAVTQGATIAVKLPLGSPGACNATECVVALDPSSDDGWVMKNGAIALPRRVCDYVVRDSSISVEISSSCASKSESLPTCGPWSSTGAPPADAGPGLPPFVEIASASHAMQLTTDSANLYYTTEGLWSIWQVPKAGGVPMQIVTGETGATSLTSDGTRVYWVIPDYAVRSVPVGGGVARTDVSTPLPSGPMAVVGGTIYWVTIGGSTDWTLSSQSTTGTVPSVIATHHYVVQATLEGPLIIDEASAYFAVRLSGGAGLCRVLLATGEIFGCEGGAVQAGVSASFAVTSHNVWQRGGTEQSPTTGAPGLVFAPKGGGALLEVRGQADFTSIASDGDSVYWSVGSEIRRSAEKGGGVNVVARPGSDIWAIVAETHSLFWSTGTTIDRLDH